MPPLPSPVRAALGLAVTVLDEARHLPDKAIELPMLAVSRALQLSLRAQQRYTTLAARGDELLASRHTTDDAPAWATFDDPVSDPPRLSVAEPDTGAHGASRSTGGSPATAPRPKPRPAKSTAPAKSVQSAKSVKSVQSAKSVKPAKTVHAPRTGTPSAFDAIGDDD